VIVRTAADTHRIEDTDTLRTIAFGLAIATLAATPRAAAANPFAGETAASVAPQTAADRRQEKRRRTGLAVGVGVSAGLVVVGALALALPMMTFGCDAGEFCDGTPLLAPIAIGSTLMVGGGIATAATGAALGHHERWHRGRGLDERAFAARRTRGLRAGVGVSAGLLAAGAVTIGAGLGGAGSCGSEACETGAVLTGVTLGPTLMIGGALSLVATATLLGLHRSHRHDRAVARVRVQPGAGGLIVKF
jgi:hypothetical protein